MQLTDLGPVIGSIALAVSIYNTLKKGGDTKRKSKKGKHRKKKR